jgi:threonine dehydrogenase-like Zn-dependent dehydrogenase
MKIAEMGGGIDAGVAEVPTPTVADNYALVKVHSAPLCTEFKYADRPKRGGFGHEAAGEVVAVGPNVRFVKTGDRVAVMPQGGCGVCELCRTGEHIFCQSQRDARAVCGCERGRETVAQYLIQQDWLLMPFPDSVPYDHIAMACCGFGPGFNAMQSMAVTAGDTVLVSGLGPVGLGAACVALFRGARVWGLEINVARTALASRIGVERVFDPRDENVKTQILDATGGRGVAVSVDTTRSETSARLLVDVAKRRGQVAFIGQGGNISVAPLVNKGLRVYGCWHWNHLRDAEQMVRTITGSSERIDTLITHTFPIDRIHDAIQTQTSGECGKVIIHPWE